MKVTPYLMFDGHCDEAMEFYRKALGVTDIQLLRFKEAPDPAMIPPGAAEKVMHGAFRVGDTEIYVSDGMCAGAPKFEGVTLTITVDSVDEANRIFDNLKDGGSVQMPMEETFFSPRFGMVADRFGVSWMVIVDKKCG